MIKVDGGGPRTERPNYASTRTHAHARARTRAKHTHIRIVHVSVEPSARKVTCCRPIILLCCAFWIGNIPSPCMNAGWLLAGCACTLSGFMVPTLSCFTIVNRLQRAAKGFSHVARDGLCRVCATQRYSVTRQLSHAKGLDNHSVIWAHAGRAKLCPKSTPPHTPTTRRPPPVKPPPAKRAQGVDILYLWWHILWTIRG